VSELSQQTRRPIGVTIIAILTIIGGIILTLSGISLIAFGAFFTVTPIDVFISEQLEQQEQRVLPDQQEMQNIEDLRSLAQFLGVIGMVIGSIVLAVGIGYLFMSYGLLKGRGWAWTITVILTVIAIVIQIVSAATASVFNASFVVDTDSFVTGIVAQIIGIAINGIILYYLYRPRVKAYFGKSEPSTAIQA
jgi:hypothetical protein